MAKLKHLPSRKKRLEKKAEGFRKDQVTETQFQFIGCCGMEHLIETKTEKAVHGIVAGEFVRRNNTLLLFVGIGEGCDNSRFRHRVYDSRQVLWFADPNEERGLVCYPYLSIASLLNYRFEFV